MGRCVSGRTLARSHTSTYVEAGCLRRSNRRNKQWNKRRDFRTGYPPRCAVFDRMKMMLSLISLRTFRGDDCGSAAVEMALVTPIFMALMFSAYDVRNYFLSEHVVVKAVRDGARFASRQSFTSMPCATGALSTSSEPGLSIDHLVRYGNVSGTGNPRLVNWTTPVTVTLSCGPALTYSGIYKGMESAVPVVTVQAVTNYQSLFNHFGITTTTITLNASSQIPVMGV